MILEGYLNNFSLSSTLQIILINLLFYVSSYITILSWNQFLILAINTCSILLAALKPLNLEKVLPYLSFHSWKNRTNLLINCVIFFFLKICLFVVQVFSNLYFRDVISSFERPQNMKKKQCRWQLFFLINIG